MTVENRPSAISVTRTVVVRIDQELDETGIGQVRRILHDLIEDQGVRDLLVDLSVGVSTTR